MTMQNDDDNNNDQPHINEEEGGVEIGDDNEEEETSMIINQTSSLEWKNRGITYHFCDNPMRDCVWILLLLRAVERGIYYGFVFINLGFLTGKCSPFIPYHILCHILMCIFCILFRRL